ncbi:MAG TPA: TadE/TadG family type IV pilus assembly protein [Candidatus Binatia bacterium]|nr:TadE/TadG family type IV pilus assembly protein [Candidatus Binatia bacterium]
MNRAGRQKCDRGTSTLEFVVVLPTLLLVFFAIMELSRAWLTVNIVTTATREGARIGSVTPPQAGDVFDSAAAEARIDEILDAANLLDVAIRSVTCPTPCVPGSGVQADVTVTFDTAVPIFLPMLVDMNISRSTTMRYE